MNPLQPQAAGLPSGRIGARRGSAHSRLARHGLLATPQRLACAAGSLLLAAGGVWFGALHWAAMQGMPPPLLLPPLTVLALLLGLGAWPLFLAGALCAALPGWLGSAPLDARLLRLPAALVLGGWALVLAGLHGALPAAALGLAISAVGLGLAAGLVGLQVLQHRQAGAGLTVALPAVAVLLVPAVGNWVAAVALALGHPGWL